MRLGISSSSAPFEHWESRAASMVHRVHRRTVTSAHVLSINEEVGLLHRPVHGVGVEVGHIDRQPNCLKILCAGRIAQGA